MEGSSNVNHQDTGKDAREANKLKDAEIRLQGYFFGTDDLEYGKYIPILLCLTCYMYDESEVICSECAQVGHRLIQSDGGRRMCVN